MADIAGQSGSFVVVWLSQDGLSPHPRHDCSFVSTDCQQDYIIGHRTRETLLVESRYTRKGDHTSGGFLERVLRIFQKNEMEEGQSEMAWNDKASVGPLMSR